jgi:hypothetical protein
MMVNSFSLTMTRDEDIGTFGDKLLGCGKTDTAGATRDQGDFSF